MKGAIAVLATAALLVLLPASASADSYFAPTGALSEARQGLVGAPLFDGRALVAGGQVSESVYSDVAEIYDPVTGTFAGTDPMTVPRGYAAAAPLSGTRILVAGGYNGTVLASAEIYDASSGDFIPVAGSLGTAHYGAVAAPLPDGRVLVAGGTDGNDDLRTAEIFDPFTATFSPTGSTVEPHYGGIAAPLTDGTVLVAGGLGTPEIEIYDP